ncbi:uncharacterized protein LOC125166397 [Prionailurus viverrinus]|uniref:uncharacterized protein LOC125166397 n=1 Tax=Prionailurus viverrinus TaxID=61388 RepID=UPI001FF4EB74|nr:uncharacterized protein LOC125166397 [Prionailurus viverrinus]
MCPLAHIVRGTTRVGTTVFILSSSSRVHVAPEEKSLRTEVAYHQSHKGPLLGQQRSRQVDKSEPDSFLKVAEGYSDLAPGSEWKICPQRLESHRATKWSALYTTVKTFYFCPKDDEEIAKKGFTQNALGKTPKSGYNQACICSASVLQPNVTERKHTTAQTGFMSKFGLQPDSAVLELDYMVPRSRFTSNRCILGMEAHYLLRKYRSPRTDTGMGLLGLPRSSSKTYPL